MRDLTRQNITFLIFSEVACGELPTKLQNGNIIYNGDTATFICNDNAILAPTSSPDAFCSSNGTWIFSNQQPPKCVEIPKEVQEKINSVEKNFIEQVVGIFYLIPLSITIPLRANPTSNLCTRQCWMLCPIYSLKSIHLYWQN